MNTCANSTVRIVAVECDSVDLQFNVDPGTKLAPGEKIEISFIGDIPAVSDTVANITVYYAMDTITPVGYRTQGFRLLNGEAAESEETYVSSEAVMPFDGIINETIDSILKSAGLKEVFSMIYSIINYWVGKLI